MRISKQWLARLVLWYAGYQILHILGNLRVLAILLQGGGIGFPALPPISGWEHQASLFFIGMASMDSLNALISLFFTWGFFKERRWAPVLGLIVLTISVYSALLFAYETFIAGAWRPPNLSIYLLINITFLPVIILYIIWLKRCLHHPA